MEDQDIMSKVAAFVDCVSLYCPSVYTKTFQKLARIEIGGLVEVICNSRFEASRLKEDLEKLCHRVVSINRDEMENYHVIVEKTH